MKAAPIDRLTMAETQAIRDELEQGLGCLLADVVAKAHQRGVEPEQAARAIADALYRRAWVMRGVELEPEEEQE